MINVLVIDDNESIQRFDDNFFDLVTTDLSMPEIDGNGVARYIRNSDRPNTSIIGISGTPWLFEENKFDLVLQKPFKIKEMENSVKQIKDKYFNRLLAS